MEYGITDQGFVVKPFSVILREQQEEFRAYFGEDLDLDDTSITGAYIKNLSLKFSQFWELLGLLYSTCDVDDSFSVYLDRLVNLVNVQRLAPTNTEVTVACFGSKGTVIPKGHVIRIEDGAFFTNKKYVFKNETKTKEEFWKVFVSFYVSRLATLGIEELMFLILCDFLGFNKTVITFLSQVFIFIGNYLLSKLFVFRKKDGGGKGE